MTVKRATRRVSFVAKIEAQAGGFPFIALAENISEGGMLVRTTNPMDENAVLHLRFTLPGTNNEIRANAVVRHVALGQSMGLKFEGLDDKDLESIRQYVDAA